MKDPNTIEIEKTIKYMLYVKDEMVVKATKRAIGRALRTGTKSISVAVRQEGYKVRSNRVKATVQNELNVTSKKLDEISGALIVPHVPMSLGYFNPKKVQIVTRSKRGKYLYRTGYSIQVKRKRKLVAGAFMMKSKGGDNLYMRTGKERTPFRKLFTTSVRDVVSHNAAIEFIRNDCVRMFEKTFNDALTYLLKKGK